MLTLARPEAASRLRGASLTVAARGSSFARLSPARQGALCRPPGGLPPAAAAALRPRRGHATVTAAAAQDAPQKVHKDVQRYWEEVLEGVDKPTAKKLLAFVDPSLPLGLNVAPAGAAVAPGDGRRGSRPPLYPFFLKTKKLHPTKVLLVRVGEFYETTGIDAILLVQHAGLNPMGNGNPPRAGCPRVNLRRTVADLVDAGLSVVVCEEVREPYAWGSVRSRQKDRYVAACVTPASPSLVHGLVDEGQDLALESAPPLLGVAPRVGGYAVIEVDSELMTVTVTEGLTEDAVAARLHEGGLAPPLFVHAPRAAAAGDARLSESTAEGEWERRVGAVFRGVVGGVVRYDDADAVAGMMERVRNLLNLPPDAVFRVITGSARDRPRPLYFSSAANLGLHKTRGVPSLLDHVLPPGAPLAARRWLRRLLLLPPPPRVGLAVQAACRELRDARHAIPSFPVMSAANVVLKLRDREANDTFFRELGDLCRAVGAACASPDLAPLADAVLVPASADTGVAADRVSLASACLAALEAIHAVVDHDTEVGTGLAWESGGGGGEEEEESGGAGADANAAAASGEDAAPAAGPLVWLYAANEGYRGRVRAERLAGAYSQVSDARARVQAAATAALDAASAAGAGAKAGVRAPSLFFDVANNAVWVRMPGGSAAAATRKLHHPRDRNGKVEGGAYSTAPLDHALDDYRRACAAAEEAVRQQLRDLAESLQPTLANLVTASTFAVVAAALDCHVREAARRGWALPRLEYGPDAALTGDSAQQQQQRSDDPGEGLVIEGMWPYWLDGLDPATVRNSFCMGGMFLLTGPNMAGKSTLLRSTCAVALLGACGLAAPAQRARLPYVDAFMLRNFSADAPLEGRSSFAVEMSEMRFVLEDATRRSLVLVDELGKGTEVRAGAALAGAMLEALEAAGSRGVFATHLHLMLDLPLRLDSTRRMMMEVAAADDGGGPSGVARRRPTWRMVPGTSTESLALSVAQECRLPEEVVARAAELYERTAAPELSPAAAPRASAAAAAAPAAFSAEAAAAPPAHGAVNGQLLEVATLLEATARRVLQELQLAGDGARVAREERYQLAATAPPLGPVAAAGGWEHLVRSQLVAAGQNPPPRTAGRSCVYVARRTDGWFYVGSTDAIADRMAAHRRRGGGTKVADPGAEFAYVALTVGEGSSARVVEAAVIRALQAEGFPLLSTADARRRHAPGGR